MNATATRLFICLALLTACAPRAAPSYRFADLTPERTLELIAPFRATLNALGIRFEQGQGYRYDGGDARAFLIAADQFYTMSPGFCPLRQDAFHFIDGSALFMTIAARGSKVRLFVYDRSKIPAFEFLFADGQGDKTFEVTPCRTVGSRIKSDSAR